MIAPLTKAIAQLFSLMMVSVFFAYVFVEWIC